MDIRKRLWIVGHVLLVCSAILTLTFGVSFASDWKLLIALPIGLVCASVASAYLWPLVYEAGRAKEWVKFGVLAILAALSTTVDLTTNFGSVAWQRGSDIETAQHQNVVHSDTRDSVATAKANLASAKRQLEALQTQHAWAASANAIQLRQNIAELQKAADREAARGGCGPKCESIKARIISMTENLGVIERREDLSKRIAATIQWLEASKQKAEATPKAQSAALMQTASLASMFTLSLDPDRSSMHWTNNGVAWLIALFFGLGATGCIFASQRMSYAGNVSQRRDYVSRETPVKQSRVTELVPAMGFPVTAKTEHKAQEFDRLTIADAIARLKAA